MRAVLEGARGLTAQGPDRLHPYLELGEAIAVHALGPPVLDELLSSASPGVARLEQALGAKANQPEARFRSICRAFTRTDWAALEAWSGATFRAALLRSGVDGSGDSFPGRG